MTDHVRNPGPEGCPACNAELDRIERREAELRRAEAEWLLRRNSMDASSFPGRERTAQARAEVERLRGASLK